MPAICPNGHVFDSGVWVENVSDATFVGNQSQCPECGAMGVIPDGLYDAVGETLNVVAASDYSREQLEWIVAWLQRARSERMGAALLADALEERAPEIADVVRRYLVPRNAGDVYAFLTLLATLIGLWLAQTHERSQPPPSPAQQQQLVEKAVQQAIDQP